MSFLFLSGSPAKGSSKTGPDFKACRRAALIRRNSFFIRLEFYGIRGPRRERKKEARRIPVHYKDSVFFGINKVFGADSTECGKNRTFRRIGRTERREGNRRRSSCRCGPYRTRPLHEVIQYLFFLLFSMIVSKFSLPHSFSRIKWGIRVRRRGAGGPAAGAPAPGRGARGRWGGGGGSEGSGQRQAVN